MSSDDKPIEISYVPDDTGIEEDSGTGTVDDPILQDLKKKASSKKVHNKIRAQEKIIEKLTAERDEFKDKYLRNLAEIDNFRKRIKKEKEEYQKYALGDFLKELLVVTDNLERALKVRNGDAQENSIRSGVEMIYRQFMDLLGKNGVSEITALNHPFDPNIHQALSRETADTVTEPTVIEVYQKGFMYNNKLLRPSLTKVAIPPESSVDREEKE